MEEEDLSGFIILWGFFLGFFMAVWIILLIMPTMYPCSLWNLRNFLWMTKPQLFKFHHRNLIFSPTQILKLSLLQNIITMLRNYVTKDSRLTDCLQSAFSLKISPVLISSSAITNQDVIIYGLRRDKKRWTAESFVVNKPSVSPETE